MTKTSSIVLRMQTFVLIVSNNQENRIYVTQQQ
jgi:hypothetical protein